MKILLNEAQRELYNELVGIYGAMVSQNNTSKLVGKSIATLYRERVEGVGIAYKQGNTKGKNKAVHYPLHEIVKYLTSDLVQTVRGAWYEIIIN